MSANPHSQYFFLGRNNSQNNNGNSGMIKPNLDALYKVFCKEQIANKDVTIQKTQTDLELLENQMANDQDDFDNLDRNAKSLKNKIEATEENLSELEGQEPDINYVPFVVVALVTLMLTFYLFIFYSSLSFLAVFKSGESTGEIQETLFPIGVFGELAGSSGGVIAMSFLLPFLFIGLGFLIHDSIEKKSYKTLVTIAIGTVLVDFLLAYVIAKKNYEIYKLTQNAIGNDVPNWEMDMAITSPDFYLVIALGLVVYIIWGVLLNRSFQYYDDIQPDKVKETKKLSLKSKIQNDKNELTNLNSQLAAMENKLKIQKENRIELQNKLIKLNNGFIAYSLSDLKSVVGDFINGWADFLNFNLKFNENNLDNEIKLANQIAEKWIASIWDSNSGSVPTNQIS